MKLKNFQKIFDIVNFMKNYQTKRKIIFAITFFFHKDNVHSSSQYFDNFTKTKHAEKKKKLVHTNCLFIADVKISNITNHKEHYLDTK